MKLESRKKLVFKSNIYKLTVISFVTVAIWIGLEIYRSYQTKELPTTIKAQISPLDPNLDTQLIDSLSRRKTITVADFEKFQSQYSTPDLKPVEKFIPPVSTSSAEPITDEEQLGL